MPHGDLIHPRMTERLERFYPQSVTIQEPVVVTDPDSGEQSTTWADFAAHVALNGRQGPTGGREVLQSDQTYVIADWTISLNGYYPTITEIMSAVVSGVRYRILLVQADSETETTRLLTREVT